MFWLFLGLLVIFWSISLIFAITYIENYQYNFNKRPIIISIILNCIAASTFSIILGIYLTSIKTNISITTWIALLILSIILYPILIKFVRQTINKKFNKAVSHKINNLNWFLQFIYYHTPFLDNKVDRDRIKAYNTIAIPITKFCKITILQNILALNVMTSIIIYFS